MAQKFSHWLIMKIYEHHFLNFHKTENLEMNAPRDFFFGERYDLKEKTYKKIGICFFPYKGEINCISMKFLVQILLILKIQHFESVTILLRTSIGGGEGSVKAQNKVI